jgi:16S rRNA (guanine527-N7)-methyltransferase
METENRNLLIEGSKSFGLSLEEESVGAFDRYLKELLKWNSKINLTAIRAEKEVVLKHFLDSLSVIPYLPESGFLLDIGSGAGFPGIGLKIVRPCLRIILIDSVGKKVDFQRHMIRTLGLKEIEALQARVQDREILDRYGGQFDIVVSRAFSDLRTFLDLAHPFLKEGGLALAMKGRRETDEALFPPEVQRGSYQLTGIHTFLLPFSRFERSILLFKKQSG